MPLDCTSYHIEVGALKRAVESPEQGRALFLSGLRGLRTSVEWLRLSDGDGEALAEQFVAFSDELECVATSAEGSGDSERSHDDNEHHIPDTFSQMMEKLRELQRKRAEITDQIRALAGFEYFLRAVPFDALQTAASCGPIIILTNATVATFSLSCTDLLLYGGIFLQPDNQTERTIEHSCHACVRMETISTRATCRSRRIVRACRSSGHRETPQTGDT